MHLHTLHILRSGFWQNTAPLSCRSRHKYHISHRVTFSYSRGLREGRTPIWGNGGQQNKIRRRNYWTSRKRISQNVSKSGRHWAKRVAVHN
jgi:hypothetical protein